MDLEHLEGGAAGLDGHDGREGDADHLVHADTGQLEAKVPEERYFRSALIDSNIDYYLIFSLNKGESSMN